MDHNGTDVVWMCFEGCNLLGGVVVVDAELEVIAAADDPVLAGDKAAGAHGHVGQFEGLDDGLRFVGPDVHVAAVEGRKDLGRWSVVVSLCSSGGKCWMGWAHPWLGGVEVDALDSLTAREQLSL